MSEWLELGGKRLLPKCDRMGEHRQMTSRDRQAEVMCLVAHERGLSSEKIHLSDRLLHDLGMARHGRRRCRGLLQ